MKNYLIPLLILLSSCMQPTAKISVAEPSPKSDVQLCVIVDRSASFIKRYTYPDPQLFKPLCDRIAGTATLDFRYGCIFSNSDIEFDRYYMPYNKPQGQSQESNPWLKSDQKVEPVLNGTNWNEFATSVRQKISLPPTKSSDISSIIDHALLTYQENIDSSNKTRKILLVCTDFKDSYQDIPPIPSGIEVISVGVLSGVPVEQILHTKVKRFENLNAAIEYLLSTF